MPRPARAASTLFGVGSAASTLLQSSAPSNSANNRAPPCRSASQFASPICDCGSPNCSPSRDASIALAIACSTGCPIARSVALDSAIISSERSTGSSMWCIACHPPRRLRIRVSSSLRSNRWVVIQRPETLRERILTERSRSARATRCGLAAMSMVSLRRSTGIRSRTERPAIFRSTCRQTPKESILWPSRFFPRATPGTLSVKARWHVNNFREEHLFLPRRSLANRTSVSGPLAGNGIVIDGSRPT